MANEAASNPRATCGGLVILSIVILSCTTVVSKLSYHSFSHDCTSSQASIIAAVQATTSPIDGSISSMDPKSKVCRTSPASVPIMIAPRLLATEKRRRHKTRFSTATCCPFEVGRWRTLQGRLPFSTARPIISSQLLPAVFNVLLVTGSARVNLDGNRLGGGIIGDP